MSETNYCVYAHTSPSGKVYIGISKNIKLRWRRNGSTYLRINKKTGEYCHLLFANAIIKYGWNNIKHEILYNSLTEKDAKLKEGELIAYYKSKKMSYNIVDSQYNTSYMNNRKPIVQISSTLKIIKEWESSADASRDLNIESTHITRAIRKKCITHGYYWIYKSELSQLNEIVFKVPHSQKIYQLDQNTKAIINVFSSIKHAANVFNVSQDAIGNAISKKYKSCGYYWIKESEWKNIHNIKWKLGINEYNSQSNLVIIENIDTGEQMSFKSQMAMCRFLGYKTQSSFKKNPNNMRGWKVVN